ncbi:hypothetical protein, partial [Nocardia vulneris]
MGDFWSGVVDVLGWVAGSDWPDGSETGMRGLADDWRNAAEGIRGIESDVLAAKSAALAAYPHGVARDEIGGVFQKLLDGTGATKEQENQNLKKMAEFFDGIATSCDKVGDEIEYAKWMMASSLGLLALEIAAAWLFPPTAPAVEAGAIIATRFAIRMIAQRVMAAITRALAKMVSSAFAKWLMKHVAIDLALGTMQDLGIQQMQVWQGNRKGGVDWGQVGMTALSSGLGAAAAGPVGDKLGNMLSGKMKPFFAGAVTGMAAGTVGAVAGALPQFALDVYKNGWGAAFSNLDPRMFTAGVSNGAMSGGNKALANGYFSSSPKWGGGVRVDPVGVPRVGSLGTLTPTGVGAGANSPAVHPSGANGLGNNGSGAQTGTTGSGTGAGRTGDGAGTGGNNNSGRAGDGSRNTNSGTGDGSSSRTSTGDGSSSRTSTGDGSTQTSGDGSNRTNPSSAETGAQQHDRGGSESRAADGGRHEGASESRASDGGRHEGGSENRAGAAPEQAGSSDQSRSGATDQGGSAQDRGTAGETGNTGAGADRNAGSQHTGVDSGAPVQSGQSAPQHNPVTTADPARTGGDGSQPRAGVPGEARPHTGAEPVRGGSEPVRGGEQARTQSGGETRATDPRAGSPEARPGAERPRVDSRASVADPNARAGTRDSTPGIRAESSGEEAPRAKQRVTSEAGDNVQVRSDAGDSAVRPPTDAPRSGEAAPRTGEATPRSGEATPRSGEAPRSGDTSTRPETD